MIDIPKVTIDKWKSVHEATDTWKMVEAYDNAGYGVAYPEMFQRALKLGRCRERVYTIMDNHYSAKLKRVKKKVKAIAA